MTDDPVELARFLADGMVRPDLTELFRRLEAGDESVLREFAPLIERVDENVVWDSTEQLAPDVPAIVHGPAGVVDYFRRWLAAWELFSWTTANYEQRGDDVIYDVHISARGRDTGVPVEEDVAHRMTIKAGKLVAWRLFRERGDAYR